MEDHLNNKDKLDKEWKALEKYEAEPSTASVAALPANKSKIRPNAQPPYDHNRVVLNPVTNAEGGDFINASTLTDHDPRNPAYITTQVREISKPNQYPFQINLQSLSPFLVRELGSMLRSDALRITPTPLQIYTIQYYGITS